MEQGELARFLLLQGQLDDLDGRPRRYRRRTTTPGSTSVYGSLPAGARRVAAAVVGGGVVDAVITPPSHAGAGWGTLPRPAPADVSYPR